MWHRIQNQQVAESSEQLPPGVADLPPGAILNEGWRQGAQSPVPFHDPSKETVAMDPRYDPYTGVVLEAWRVEPRDRFEMMGAAMLARREEAAQRKLKGRRY